MGRGATLSREKRAQIVALYNAGFSQRRIARDLQWAYNAAKQQCSLPSGDIMKLDPMLTVPVLDIQGLPPLEMMRTCV